MTTAPYLLTHSRRFPVLLITGFVVGVVDIVYAFLFYGMYGATPTRILQSVASGLLGRASFGYGGRSAALGLALHFFIAYSITAIYFLLAKRISWLIAHPVVSGICYGAGVYTFMHVVVIPLSASPKGHIRLVPAICEFIEHMLLVGLPISFAARAENSNLMSRKLVGE